MIQIPDCVRRLFYQDGVHKNCRIEFPNGERGDICNDQIVAESLRMTESLCSRGTLKFGVVEPSKLTVDVVGVENIKGMKIRVWLEIDCSSLAPEEIAEYAQTRDDLDHPIYPIPYGTYTVDSCDREAGSKRRKVVSYSSDISEIGEIALSKFEKDKITQLPSKTNRSFIGSMIRFIASGLNAKIGGAETPVAPSEQSFLYPESYLYVRYLDESVGYEKSGYLYVSNLRVLGGGTWRIATHTRKQRTWSFGIEQDALFYINVPLPSTREKMQQRFNTEIKPIIDDLINDPQTQWFVARNPVDFEKISDQLNQYIQDFENIVMYNVSRNGTYLLPTITASATTQSSSSYVPDYSGRVEVPMSCGERKTIYPYANLKDNLYGGLSASFDVISTAALMFNDDMLGNNQVFTIEYFDDDNMPSASRVDTEYGATVTIKRVKKGLTYWGDIGEVNLRKLSESQAELMALFLINKRESNAFETISLSRDIGLYPTETLYPSDTLYPSSSEQAFERGMYLSAWYGDAQYMPFSKVTCTRRSSSGEDVYLESVIVQTNDNNKRFFREYDVSTNDIITNEATTNAQATAYINSMAEKIKGVPAYMPCQIKAIGLPYLECGDAVDFATEDGIISTFIMRRTISGIQHLVDTIEST